MELIQQPTTNQDINQYDAQINEISDRKSERHDHYEIEQEDHLYAII